MIEIGMKVLYRGNGYFKDKTVDGWTDGYVHKITKSGKFITIVNSSDREFRASFTKYGWRTGANREVLIETEPGLIEHILKERKNSKHPVPEVALKAEMNDKIFEALKKQGMSEETINDTLQTMDE